MELPFPDPGTKLLEDHNPMRTDTEAGRGPSLNWGGRLLIGLIFAVGVALLIYGGLIAGMLIGLDRGTEVANNTPPRNTGLAPDLTGLVEGTFEVAKSALIGAGIGLIVGLIVMWAVSRFLLTPLFRRVPAFTSSTD